MCLGTKITTIAIYNIESGLLFYQSFYAKYCTCRLNGKETIRKIEFYKNGLVTLTNYTNRDCSGGSELI